MDGGGGGGGDMSPFSCDRYSDDDEDEDMTGRLTLWSRGLAITALDATAAVVEDEVMVMRVVLLPLRPVVDDDDDDEDDEPDFLLADALHVSRFSFTSIRRSSDRK